MSAAYGQPATISQLPTPAAAKNISSSTPGAGTVITTSAAHGLQTGGAVIISGHLLNTNANGIWIATVTGSTTFKISSFSGFATPTYIAGNGTGVNTGTVQSLALPGVDLPEDAVTTMDAASVNVPMEGLLDMTAWLAYVVLARIPVPYAVGDSPDADASLDCAYEELRIPNTLAADRTYTLISTAGGKLPINGSRLRFSRTGSLLTHAVSFVREGAAEIASIAAGTPASVDFVYRTSDSKWHVSAWSGNTTVNAVI